jgi:hypothetical protein
MRNIPGLSDVMHGLGTFLEYRNNMNLRTVDVTYQMICERKVREGCVLIKDERELICVDPTIADTKATKASTCRPAA